MRYLMFYGVDNFYIGGGRRYKSAKHRLVAAKRFQKKQERKHGIFFLDVNESAKAGERVVVHHFDDAVDIRGAILAVSMNYEYLMPAYLEAIYTDTSLYKRICTNREEWGHQWE